MRATQSVNKEQLTEATFNYLVGVAKKMGVPPPQRDELKDLRNEVISASRIHASGWIVYSIQTLTITSDDVTNIEERVIELK